MAGHTTTAQHQLGYGAALFDYYYTLDISLIFWRFAMNKIALTLFRLDLSDDKRTKE